MTARPSGPRARIADIAQQRLHQAEMANDDDGALVAFDTILYELLIIGEAVKALPATMQAAEPKVPWRDIARMRDLLAHHYYRVDAQTVRATIDAPLGALGEACDRLAGDPDGS